MEAAVADLRRVFTPDRSAPAAARHAVAELASDFDAETQFRLELLVTELVSNAVVHGPAGDGNEIALDVHASPRQVHVTVVDNGPGFDTTANHNGGKGLLLVSRLSESWGADSRGGRSAVWFLLRRTPASGAASAALEYAGRVASAILGRRRQTSVDPYID